VNAETGTQLELIGEIAAALDAARVDWWLFGGWALDAHAGKITRDHSDIELFSWKHDAAKLRDALEATGFVHPSGGLYPNECQSFLKHGQEIGAWFIERDAAGTIFTPGRWADWPWIAGAFDDPPILLEGIPVRAVSIEGLLDMKTNYSAHPYGAPLREKDKRDIELLQQLKRKRDP
jgi:hypothetical protein